MSNSTFEGFFKSLLKQLGRKLLKKALEKKPEAPKQEPKKEPNEPELKIHPWRLCPIGQHWVVTHPLRVPITEKNPSGSTPRQGHCADNPTRGSGKNKYVTKDYLSKLEIEAIAEQYFSTLAGPPTTGKLTEPDADKYDHLIRGWTKYWNEVLKPDEPLDPNLVKALIASESTFDLKPKDQKTRSARVARGYIQLTDEAIHALANPESELKDHFVEFSTEDAYDANMSICAGIRWLFRKRRLASGKLGREATWLETIAEYKSYLNGMRSGRDKNPKGMQVIESFYKKLKNEK